jgi:hypothetical protein
MDFVKAERIVSPISGQPVNPRIIEKTMGDKIFVEAHWYDPSSGTFIRKGLVKVLDAETGNDISGSCKFN